MAFVTGFYPFSFISRSFIQGLGNGFVPTLAGFAELVMRALVAILGAHFFGYSGVRLTNPAAWIGAVNWNYSNSYDSKKGIVKCNSQNL